MEPTKNRSYQVVEATSIPELERKVHHQITVNGWALQGGVTALFSHVGVPMYFQAMVDPRRRL